MNWLSGFGWGAVVAAIIGGCVVYLVEGRRQQGENTRKQMDLKRQDERQWNNDIRQSFIDARAELNDLSQITSWTRLLAHVSDAADDIEKQFNRALAVHRNLSAVEDGLRIIAEDELVDQFSRATKEAADFLDKFTVSSQSVSFPLEEANKPRVDYSNIERQLLEAVRKALRTPDYWQLDSKKRCHKRGDKNNDSVRKS